MLVKIFKVVKLEIVFLENSRKSFEIAGNPRSQNGSKF